MLQTINGSSMERIVVVDDTPDARADYSDQLKEIGLRPIEESGPLGALDLFVEKSCQHGQAAICDYRMKSAGYANFDGAILVSRYYQRGFPALLCTRFEHSPDEIRPLRKYIPVLLDSDEIDPDTIQFGLEQSVAELRGKIPPGRRPWRTLVHIQNVDNERGFAYFFLPGWDPHQGLRLQIDDIPEDATTPKSSSPASGFSWKRGRP